MGLEERVLEKIQNKRSTGASMLQAVDDGISLGRRAKTAYQNHVRWSVTISSNDRLYNIAQRWFLSKEADAKPPRSLKAALKLSGRSRAGLDFLEDYPASAPANRGGTSTVELYFNEKSTRTVTIDGHKVSVSLNTPERDAPGGLDGGYRPPSPDVLYFHARSREGQQAVVNMLMRLAQDQDKRKPSLHLLTTWGDWSRRDDLPERTLDSVVLAEGQMERLRDDLQRFLDEEDEYVRRGMPYHRGYLLHGPPGTGKTSIVRAMAAHFGLDLWYAPLGDLQKDSSLMSLINQVQPGSILLLEDIDIYHSSRNREDDQPGMSMAGLLNALDGVATPHGLITFMTTNDVSVIDEALVRPGRVDLREEIGLPDSNQIGRLFNSWYDTKLDPAIVENIQWTGTTADVTELFKQNLNDSETALGILLLPRKVVEERSVTVPKIVGGKNAKQARRIQGKVVGTVER